jgi:hypothetical protein
VAVVEARSTGLAAEVFAHWVDRFGAALGSGDVLAAAACFAGAKDNLLVGARSDSTQRDRRCTGLDQRRWQVRLVRCRSTSACADRDQSVWAR